MIFLYEYRICFLHELAIYFFFVRTLTISAAKSNLSVNPSVIIHLLLMQDENKVKLLSYAPHRKGKLVKCDALYSQIRQDDIG